MATESNESVQAAEDRKVPEDLLQRLHDANQQFHDARQQLDGVMSDAEFGHQKRIDQVEEKLRLAEREVERVTTEIDGALKSQPKEAAE